MALHPLIADRRSARALDSNATVSTEVLTDLLDAARWAPTWGKSQPVRFVVGSRGDDTFAGLAATLTEGNSWALSASALIMLTTRNTPDDAPAQTYGAVDLGLALGQLITQAVGHGLIAHPMAGFDQPRAIELFDVPASERPLVVVAIGHLASPEDTDPAIAERDNEPRKRKPNEEVAFAGKWGKPWATHPNQ